MNLPTAAASVTTFEHGWQVALILMFITGFGVVGRWLLSENTKHRQSELDGLKTSLTQTNVALSESSDVIRVTNDDRARICDRMEKAFSVFDSTVVKLGISLAIIESVSDRFKSCDPEKLAKDIAAYQDMYRRMGLPKDPESQILESRDLLKGESNQKENHPCLPSKTS